MSLACVVMETKLNSAFKIHNLCSLCYSQDCSISQDIVHMQFEEGLSTTDRQDTKS
jgi:hypothetical protein